VLKEFTYGTSNASGVWDNGKLKTADRFNYQTIGGPFTAQIRETSFYGARQGRLSQRDTAITAAGSNWGTYTQGWIYNDLGQVASIGYPDCTHAPCATQVPDPDPVSFSYTNGFLTAVPERAGSITYHPNGMVNQIYHGNGVLETHFVDPFGMRRPLSIGATYGAQVRWNSYEYQYDGAGNVVKMGAAVSLYQLNGRLYYHKLFTGPVQDGEPVEQTTHYDEFGNIQAFTWPSGGRNTPTSVTTNRLTGATYDAAGNMTSWSGNSYEFDPFNNMSLMFTGNETWYYFYNADGERIVMYKYPQNFKRFTLRGFDAKLLASYTEEGGWTIRERQIVYRDGTLLAAAQVPIPGWTALHVDHLGTPRAITDSGGSSSAYHAYHSFGEEATGFAQDSERMKFTGHERDLASPAGPGDDLDYMHARHYNFWTGRFLSTDPAGCGPDNPQRWNRYAYVLNNPLTLIDPSGMKECPAEFASCGDYDDIDAPNPYLPDRSRKPPPGGGGGPRGPGKAPATCSPTEYAACQTWCAARGRGLVACTPAIRFIFIEAWWCRCSPFPIFPPMPPIERCTLDGGQWVPDYGKTVCYYTCPGDPVGMRRVKVYDGFIGCPSSVPNEWN